MYVISSDNNDLDNGCLDCDGDLIHGELVVFINLQRNLSHADRYGRFPARRSRHVPRVMVVFLVNRKDLDRDFIGIGAVKKVNISLTFSRPPRSFIPCLVRANWMIRGIDHPNLKHLILSSVAMAAGIWG